MSGLQSDAASSRRYDDAAACSDSGKMAYDQMEATGAWQRFRHTVRLIRWRPDRDPAGCTFDQLDVPLHYDLTDVLAAR